MQCVWSVCLALSGTIRLRQRSGHGATCVFLRCTAWCPVGTSRGPPRIRVKVFCSPELRFKGNVVHPGAVEGFVERTDHSCFASHGGSCACRNERMRCRRPSLEVCLHFFKTSILGVMPLRFLVQGLPSEARRRHSRGEDMFVGKKNNHQQVDPGSGVRHPPPNRFFFPDKLPVPCLEFQIIYLRLPVFIFPRINKVILFVTTVGLPEHQPVCFITM